MALPTVTQPAEHRWHSSPQASGGREPHGVCSLMIMGVSAERKGWGGRLTNAPHLPCSRKSRTGHRCVRASPLSTRTSVDWVAVLEDPRHQYLEPQPSD